MNSHILCLCTLGYRSCGEIKDAKGNISAPYSIEIGGKTVSVSCNLTSNPAVTIIPVHDVVQVPNPGNYRKPQSYIYNVNYGKLPVSDLREFIEQSESCKQYVSYKCRNASLFGNMKNSLSSWTSVSDNPKNYWAECGFDDPNPKCHCDQEHSKPVEDAGYLLKKKDLPVKGLQIGGLSSSSNVSIIIGNIMCYGGKCLIFNPLTGFLSFYLINCKNSYMYMYRSYSTVG